MKKILALVLVALHGLSCTHQNWRQDKQSVTVFPTNTSGMSAVRIMPVGESVIRVTASADTAFSSTPGLVVLPDRKPVPFEVEDEGSRLVVSTSELKVRVSMQTGQVEFFDTDGNPVLQEKRNGGRSFEPIEVDGVKGYTLRQIFEPAEDEAIYGLGQHQAGEINYRGKNEELFQYNTKVSVPFIVSTKNYGILWDNYSFSRFGDPRPYGQMDQFVLYNKKGEQGGLTATYYTDTSIKTQDARYETQDTSIKYQDVRYETQDTSIKYQDVRYETQDTSIKYQDARYETQDTSIKYQDTRYETQDTSIKYQDAGQKTGKGEDPGNVFTERTESEIDYENLETIKKFPEGFDFNKAEITWEGAIEPRESGIFRFLLYYAGYTKIWIDNQLMADKWRTAWNPSVAKFSLDMKKGQKYHLKLEWIPDGGVSYIGLKALSPVHPEDQDDLSFWSEMGDQIDYYFMKGNSMDEVIKAYRHLTGKAQVMPRWAMGFWQSRERYKTQAELTGALQEYRKRHIPVDNIVMDWSYWKVDQWGSHEFDKDRFPDPAGMVKVVHDNHARIMISVWPKFYLGTEHYKEFNDQDWIYQQAIRDSIRDWIYPGFIGSFYDAYRPEARELFWKQIDEHLYSKGFDAWWLDATEPDILSNAGMDYRKALMNPTAFGPSTKYFNAYALMNAKGIYEGQRAKNPVDRVFILTRSGFAGMQRYGTTTWSGDIGTCWEDMEAQIPAGINFCLSGLPYWSMDIGGFSVQKRFERAKEGTDDMEEWRELNTRWFQFGTFVPIFRSHGQYPYREIYNISPENHPAYRSMVYYDKLRYRLMPYIYSLAGKVYVDDYTIMRSLAMDFPDDRQVYNIADQYLFGPSLMVCPVYHYGDRQREVYFPAGGGWYDLYTGRFTEGGQKASVDAPYERMPLFVREGSVIPVGPQTEYTGEKPDAPLDIYVYTGVDGSFSLYEDEGTNYNYEKGQYSLIPFTWSDSDKSLTIGDRRGQFTGMVKDRIFRIIVVSKEQPVAFLSKDTGAKEIQYNGHEITIKL